MMGIAELAGEYHRSVELLEDRLTQLKEEDQNSTRTALLRPETAH